MRRVDYTSREYKNDKEIARKYLGQLLRLDLIIKSKRLQVVALNDCINSITINNDSVRVDGGKNTDISDKINRVIDLKNEITQDIFKYIEFQEDMAYKIGKLDRLLAIVLELKHIHGLHNWQIAQELKYSPRSLDYIYAEALVKFKRMWLEK